MTKIRRINVSQVEGGNSDSTDTNEIRPFGETAFYLDDDGHLVLMMFDGVRTHLKSKVLSQGKLFGSNADSGDGNGYDTIKLIPDATLFDQGSNQYLVVDPTGGEPGHIHLRAGGTQDQSSADLYLGGELTFVRVSDTSGIVTVRTTNIGDPNITMNWSFQRDGNLYFPGIGNNRIGESEPGLVVSSSDAVVLQSNNNGESKELLFGTDGGLTLPGNLYGSTLSGPGGPSGRVVNITPADDASDKQFVFRIDQIGETFTRAFLDMPSAENDKQVALTFNHTNNTTGYIFTQGNNTVDDGMNNAFNIFYNSGNIKITAMSTEGGSTLRTWTFGNNGNLTLPSGGEITSFVVTNSLLGTTTNSISLIPPTSTYGFDPNQRLDIYPTEGEGNHIHLTAGDQSSTDLYLGNDSQYVAIRSMGYIDIRANIGQPVWIQTTSESEFHQWTFDSDGSMFIPNGGNIVFDSSAISKIDGISSIVFADGSIQTTAYLGGGGGEGSTGPTGPTGATGATGPTGPGVIAGGTTGQILAKSSNTDYDVQWVNQTSSYGNANVATYLASFGSNSIITTGNITVSNIRVSGAANGTTAITAGVTNTILPNTVVSFSANVNSYTQVTLQNKNSGADATADYIITADNGTDTTNFVDLGIINSGYDPNTPTNSLGNIVYAADSYLYAQGNTSSTIGGNLVIGATTVGKTVKIFAGGNTNSALVGTFANTGLTVNGNVSANNFSGNITITGNVTGTSPNVTLVAGNYSMTFDNTGLLTLPAMGGDEGGEINLGIPQTNTTLTTRVVMDVYRDRIRFFDGSTKGAYIDLSQAATGVNTLLNNRVSAYVNAGVFVTMDNLKATVTTSGNRGLSLATVSGTISTFIGGNFNSIGAGNGGQAGAVSINTTASTSIFGWGFNNQGDTSYYIVNDTTNSRAYRITLQIGGSWLNNLISIERLI